MADREDLEQMERRYHGRRHNRHFPGPEFNPRHAGRPHRHHHHHMGDDGRSVQSIPYTRYSSGVEEKEKSHCCSSFVKNILILIAVLIFIAALLASIYMAIPSTKYVELKAYHGFITLDEAWDDDMFYTRTPAYMEITSDIIEAIRGILNKESVLAVSVHSLRPGSIIVLFSVDYEQEDIDKEYIEKSLSDAKTLGKWKVKENSLISAPDSRIDLPDCLSGLEITKLFVCDECPFGTFRTASQDTQVCVACPPGKTTRYKATRHPSRCVEPCQRGYKFGFSEDKCVPCPRGTYQPIGQVELCKQCPDGLVTKNTASKDISDCRNNTACLNDPCQNDGTCVEDEEYPLERYTCQCSGCPCSKAALDDDCSIPADLCKNKEDGFRVMSPLDCEKYYICIKEDYPDGRYGCSTNYGINETSRKCESLDSFINCN